MFSVSQSCDEKQLALLHSFLQERLISGLRLNVLKYILRISASNVFKMFLFWELSTQLNSYF